MKPHRLLNIVVYTALAALIAAQSDPVGEPLIRGYHGLAWACGLCVLMACLIALASVLDMLYPPGELPAQTW